MQLLVIEDQPSDLQIATKAAESSGYSRVETRTTAGSAKVYLEDGLEGKQPLPDAVVLDLDLGYESGFELLRFWHGHPRLSKIPIIVWTVLGEEHREICRLFKVTAYISKKDGPAVLREALSNVTRAAS
jgi:CheY-like chemotaxis protein